MANRLRLAILGSVAGLILVALVLVLVLQSDSSSASDEAPTAQDVAAVLERGMTPQADVARYKDDYYRLSFEHPVANWRVSLGNRPGPHAIRVESTGDRDSEVTAFVAIQPFLAERVSDALCEDPVESQIQGHKALICTYTYGNVYEHFSPMPHEWSVISVTLMLDDGPVYISAAVMKPVGVEDAYPFRDELVARVNEVMQIVSTFEVARE